MADGQPVDLGIAGLGPATRIGSGGFADVYRAQQTNLRRDVAVKVLRAAAGDQQARMRFERECHALGAVSGHPSIVAVHEGGFTPDGRAYLVMEFCPRGSLRDQIEERGPLDASAVTDIGTKIGKALGVAHDAGVLHRDVKPANILVTAYGEPALADFGIARVDGGEQTATGLVTASLAHAAPEVLQGASPSAASDLYSLGSTMYELFAGRPAHFRPEDESPWALMNRVISEPMPDPAQAGIPEPLASTIRKATAQRPEHRFATAADFVAALTGGGAATVAAPPPVDPGHAGPPHPNDPEHGKTAAVSETGQLAGSAEHAPTQTFGGGQVGAEHAPTQAHGGAPGMAGYAPTQAFGSGQVGAGHLSTQALGGARRAAGYVPTRTFDGEPPPARNGPVPGGVGRPSPKRKRRRGLAVLLGLMVVVALGGAGFLVLTRAEGALEPLTFSFLEGLSGPLDADISYDLIVGGTDGDAGYRLLVDGEPTGPTGPTLESFTPATGGRHSVAVEVTRGDVIEVTDVIEVYVIGELPPAGYRANLGSVTADPANWTSAINRYDELIEIGHADLELLPSSRFATLTPGFWNLYVPGFGDDRVAAENYCLQFGLEIPNGCFASRFDPNA